MNDAQQEQPRALVVGGTSGLGLEISKLLLKDNYHVSVVGRRNPGIRGLVFLEQYFGPYYNEKTVESRVL